MVEFILMGGRRTRRCDACGTHVTEPECVLDEPVPPSLESLAVHAGVYDALWSPERRGWVRAVDVIAPLRAGVERLTAATEPGAAELLGIVERALAACESTPDAIVRVER